MLLDVSTSTSRAKSRGSALFQGFAITRDRGKWPLTCSFLTPSAPAECGTSPCVLTAKCCHLNPNAVSRVLIKLMDQVGIKQCLCSGALQLSPPMAPNSLPVSLCPALLPDTLIVFCWCPSICWAHCCSILSPKPSPTPSTQGPCQQKCSMGQAQLVTALQN